MIAQSAVVAIRGRSAAVGNRPSDLLTFVAIWFACASMSLVAPQPPDASTPELLYYTAYNAAVGGFVGFYLFDRLGQDGYGLFLLRGSSALIAGTLINEAFVEPLAFGASPINGQGIYYGLTDACSTAGLFLFARLARQLHTLQRDLSNARPASGHFFVRVANGTRRIAAGEVLYMKAERDFTRIVCTGAEHFVSENLKSVLAKSAELGLVRIHRSFAVNLRRVEEVSRTGVRLGHRRLPVGRRYSPSLMKLWLCD